MSSKDNFIPSRLRLQSLGVGFQAPVTNGGIKCQDITVVGTATVGTVNPSNVVITPTVGQSLIANSVGGGVNVRFRRDATNIIDFYHGGSVQHMDASQAGSTLSLNTVGVQRVTISHSGRVIVAAPSVAGASLTVNGAAGQAAIDVQGAPTSSGILQITDGQTGNRPWLLSSGLGNIGAFSIFDATAGAYRFTISTAGNVSFPAATSGITLTTAADGPGGAALNLTCKPGQNESPYLIFSNAAANIPGRTLAEMRYGTAVYSEAFLKLKSGAFDDSYDVIFGDQVYATDRGDGLTHELGFRHLPIPPLNINANYTLVQSDNGKGLAAVAPGVFVTLPELENGTIITLINASGGAISLVTPGQIFWYNGTGNPPGNRTLSAGGVVTLWQRGNTGTAAWHIWGMGLS